MAIRRNIRIYHPTPLAVNQAIELTAEAQHHLRNVLRAQSGDAVILFNGDGHDYLATIACINKKQVIAQIHSTEQRNTQSPLKIHLAQSINRGDKMDFVIQKATELGVHDIIPIISEYGNVKLNEERWEKKVTHWQKIADSACEQCGRTDLVKIQTPSTLTQWVAEPKSGTCFILEPGAETAMNIQECISEITLLVGPEGGFSQQEIDFALKHSFRTILLGPRILRSETAGLAAISVCQARWGDF
jgi:16S rRNA (uracil1498-N3)-methyltransferase